MKRLFALFGAVALIVGGLLIPRAQADVTATATATASATVTATATAVAIPSTVTVTVTATLTTIPATTTTTAPPPITALPPGSKYVAMGDSYSSGEGANQTPGSVADANMITGNCRRSTKAAQLLLTTQYGWNLVNAACSGSTTANILNTFGWEGPQMNWVTSDTKLVTMTIGGNDAQLLQLLVNCIIPTQFADCVTTNNAWSPSPAQQIAAVDTSIAALQPRIESIIDTVVSKAPTVKIRMAGYPWVIAPPGQPIGSCTWLTTGEQTMFDARLQNVNNAIKAGTIAAAARHTGNSITYLDPLAGGSPFVVTDNGCANTTTRYMNGSTGTSTNWHPNILGQQKYADLYRASL